MFTAKVRRSIYALSAVLVPLLIVVGVEESAAAAYVAVAVAVANCAMAFLNVPDDPADG
jgi:hypothetical protein